MELLYFFVKRVREEDYGVGFNFSNNYNVNYDNVHRKLEIKIKKRSFSEGFFGDNIVNVNAIVGKNGVGKTSLLNLLGLSKIDRRIEYMGSEWFAIYHICDDLFVVEGVNSDLIENAPLDIKNDYLFYFRLKDIEGDFSWNLHDDEIREVIGKLKFFHFPVMRERKPDYRGDQNLSFERFYMESNDKWVYKYLVSDYNSFNKGAVKGELRFVIKNNFSINKSSRGESLELYEDISGFYTDIPILRFEKIEVLKNKKQLFIIRVLERLINEHMVISVRKSMPENIDENINRSDFLRFIQLVGNKYSGDLKDYEGIKSFLISKLNDFVLLAEEIHGDSIDMNIGMVISLLEKIPENKFFNLNNNMSYTCVVDLESYDEDIFNLLNECNKKCIISPFSVKFPEKSDGELSIINKVSSIYGAIDNNSKKGGEYFVILLDEIDAHLHPEWSRCFLSMLVDVLVVFDKKFQLILASHYPYIISDLPCENILKIERLMDNGFQVTNSMHGFGSNMYDILNDNFFLKSPIGEFANRKIFKIINSLSSEQEVDGKDEIIEVIDLLGDPIIKKNLMQKYSEKFNGNLSRIKEIEVLEERLRRLKIEAGL